MSACSKAIDSEQFEGGVPQVYIKERFPDCKIGFSKFAELRPKQCVLAGASGTHSFVYSTSKCQVCHSKCRATNIMCNPPHPRCYLGECDVSRGIKILKEELLTHFDETDVEQIVYKQWVSDRSTFETFTSSGIC